MWGTDFAHAASEYPNSQKHLAEDFAGVPENERRAMLVDNCVRYFHLERLSDPLEACRTRLGTLEPFHKFMVSIVPIGSKSAA